MSKVTVDTLQTVDGTTSVSVAALAGLAAIGVGVTYPVSNQTKQFLRGDAAFGNTLVDYYVSLVPGPAGYRMKDSTQAGNAKEWATRTAGGLFRIDAVDDAGTTFNAAMTIARTGAAPTVMALLPGGGSVTTPDCHVIGTLTVDNPPDFNFKSTAVGAVIRGMTSKLQDIVNVKDFGAVADATIAGGGTDNTVFFQKAIAAAGVGGTAWVPTGHYRLNAEALMGTHGVTLKGTATGPFDGEITDGSPRFPVLFITANTPNTPFISMNANSCAVEDLGFFYPNQVAVSSPTPTAYPFTIGLNNASCFVRRCTFFNSYQAVDVEVGRCGVIDCNIGAFLTGILVDHAADIVRLRGNTFSQFWNVAAGVTSSTIDAWPMTNGFGMRVFRADDLRISDTFVFSTNTGLSFEDSPDNTGINAAKQWAGGQVTNVTIDTVKVAAYLKSAANLVINGFRAGSDGAGTNGIWIPAGGTNPPNVQVTGGHIEGVWSNVYTVSNSSAKLSFYNFDGISAAGALTAPSVPASTVAQKNTFPFPVRVFLAGGTVTVVKIGSTATGLTGGSFVLAAGESITLTYSAAPTWTWFGL